MLTTALATIAVVVWFNVRLSSCHDSEIESVYGGVTGLVLGDEHAQLANKKIVGEKKDTNLRAVNFFICLFY
jgi:hypothetical protein